MAEKVKYKIHRERLIDISPDLYKKFTSLSLRKIGRMRSDCSLERKRKNENVYVIYAEENNQILGWSVIFVNDRNSRFFIYVRQKSRRNGIGNALYGKANAFIKSMGKEMQVFPWDNISRAFYKNKEGFIRV